MGLRAPLALTNATNLIRRHSGDAYASSHKLLSGAKLSFALVLSHMMACTAPGQGRAPQVHAPGNLRHPAQAANKAAGAAFFVDPPQVPGNVYAPSE